MSIGGLQVLRDAVEDPSETAAAVAAANAALEEDEWPGLRPPRKRQKRTAPGQAQVRGVPGPLNSPAAVCDVPEMQHKALENAWWSCCSKHSMRRLDRCHSFFSVSAALLV